MLDGVGQIVILNGPPRSGKSSIATVIQGRFDGVWTNLGVDRFMSSR
jgi:chloramphenicol 3-O phosphotransferase